MTGMNLREAIGAWERCGGRATPLRRTGEVACTHPAVGRRIVVSACRKDAPRILTTTLKKIRLYAVPESRP